MPSRCHDVPGRHDLFDREVHAGKCNEHRGGVLLPRLDADDRIRPARDVNDAVSRQHVVRDGNVSSVHAVDEASHTTGGVRHCMPIC